jgi:glyoxylase-like metal-dependent hydrolase (beta-lactamase superfamily II)
MGFDPIRLDAANPGPMTGGGNHTYLVAADEGDAVLVDAGVGHPQHLAALGTVLEARRSHLCGVVVTHAHQDHISGVDMIAALHADARFLKFPSLDADRRFQVQWQPVRDGDRIRAGSHDLEVIHTPGHSPDHIALWHQASRTAFTGDLVVAGASVTIPASHGGNMTEYLASLERIIALGPSRLLPAHGPDVDDPDALLRAYRAHRLQREAQVVEALSAGLALVPDIAGTIYDGLAPALLPAAHETVRAHLEKLRHEGRAVDEDGRWRLLLP